MIFFDLAAFDDEDVDRLLEKQAEMEKGDGEAAGPVGEQRVIGTVADFPPFLVVDLLHDVGGGMGRGRVGAMRLLARLRLEEIEGERRRLAVCQSVGRSRRDFADRADGDGCGGAFQHRATIEAIRHVQPSILRKR